ncbi:MAG TPA: ABC transporter ATP-binding protein, partial [Polyangiaceae bacterium]|nr:ABC transporter ATP-binding protein [Polyangiaceae bacterium]
LAYGPRLVNAPAIRAQALVKLYGQELAVAGVDLEVPSGECFGLVGPNGAGKTTTVEMLEGLHRPDSGTIELFGLRWGEGKDREIQQRFGVQLQETQLADKLSVEEVLELFRSFYPRGRDVDELIELLDLGAERSKHYHKLSGGQKQRVALGAALCGDPELLFLDEPTTGLDPRARKALWSIIERFREEGRTVLITTHYMEEAATLCDRIAIMDRGKIIALGTPRSLVDGLGLVQFVEFETRQPLDDTTLTALPPVSALEKRGERYRLQIERSLAALQSVLAELERQQVTPIGLSTHQATLDDVFLKLTGRALKNEGTTT